MCMHNYFDSACVAIKHKIATFLIGREKEHGLIYYIALSQVTKVLNLETKDTERISKNKIKIINKNCNYSHA